MTATLPTSDAIRKHILSDIQTCQNLIRLLQEENSALNSRNFDNLEEILERKNIQLNLLDNSVNTRMEWIKLAPDNQNNDTRAIWDKMLSDINRIEISEAWITLQNLIDQCRQKNEVNGKIVIRNQAIFSKLLKVLRGQNGPTTLYTAKGSSHDSSQAQHFGSA